jgi:hypothetical protein
LKAVDSVHSLVCYGASKLAKSHGFRMNRGKQFDVGEKAKILAWHSVGLSAKEIAGKLKRHDASIRKVIRDNKALPEDALPPAPKRRSGRPRIMKHRHEERLRRYLLRFPFKTAKELKAEVPGCAKLSVRQIQFICKQRLALPSGCAAKKPLLTAKMIRKRLTFCKKYRKWTEKNWDSVMFSDESTFRLINPRAQKVRRPSTVCRYKQRYTVVNVKHSTSVMIWGCFSGNGGRGSLYFLPPKDTMNSERYMAMLEDKLFFWMKLHRATHFLQDGAPCHTSKRVMKYLKENNVSVLDWPGNSPDLNPVVYYEEKTQE